MPTTERARPEVRRRRRILLALGLVTVGAVVVLLVCLRRPPQMGADAEVFRAVDALFTAVTARDAQRVTRCEERLRAHCDAGKLPREAADYLDGVIAQARGGEWRSAADRLYHFMSAQRREGSDQPTPPKKGKRPSPAGRIPARMP